MPEAAHVLPHLGARPHAGQLGVLGRDQVVVVATVSNVLGLTICTAHDSFLFLLDSALFAGPKQNSPG
ncbi:hypothetical protein D9M68_781830 [compost metagenome]